MEFENLDIPGAIAIRLDKFVDDRGFFGEIYRSDRYADAGIPYTFCQDSRSFSKANVLRGLHYQVRFPQGHLITVTRGRVFDVGLDLRRNSPTYGKWFGMKLTADPPMQLFLPPGIAHGFCVLSDHAEIWYKCTGFYVPNDEGGVLWNDPELAIQWPIAEPVVSARDAGLPRLAEVSEDRLPVVA